MSSDQYQLPAKDCLLFHKGTVMCVPAMNFISKCNPDFTYWPYDKHQCRVTFVSWTHKGEEVDLLLNSGGVCALVENHLVLLLFDLLSLLQWLLIPTFPNNVFLVSKYWFKIIRKLQHVAKIIKLSRINERYFLIIFSICIFFSQCVLIYVKKIIILYYKIRIFNRIYY